MTFTDLIGPWLGCVAPRETPKRIGVAADHGGYELKVQLARKPRDAGYEVTDFSNSVPNPNDDYPDFVEPLGRAVARGAVERGVAISGSGVGACSGKPAMNAALQM